MVYNKFTIHRMRRERRHVTAVTSSHGVGGSSSDNVTQMTALCLSASFCFLVCVTPSMILLIGKPYWNKPGNHWYDIAKSITNQVIRSFSFTHSYSFIKHVDRLQKKSVKLSYMKKLVQYWSNYR